MVKKREIILEIATTPVSSKTNSEKNNKRFFNMLVAIPSPRDIAEFRQTVDDCIPEYDRVWFKYFRESVEPYKQIKKYFLRHWDNGKKYTHLAILPDDIILNKNGINKLVRSVKNNPKKYKVMMGTFSIVYDSDQLALCQNLPAREHDKRTYNFYTKDEVKGKGIISVGWCGTPFVIISGELIAEGIVTLDNDFRWNPHTREGSSQDVVLAHDLTSHNIPIWVDTDVYFIHLKGLPVAEVNYSDWVIPEEEEEEHKDNDVLE